MLLEGGASILGEAGGSARCGPASGGAELCWWREETRASGGERGQAGFTHRVISHSSGSGSPLSRGG